MAGMHMYLCVQVFTDFYWTFQIIRFLLINSFYYFFSSFIFIFIFNNSIFLQLLWLYGCFSPILKMNMNQLPFSPSKMLHFESVFWVFNFSFMTSIYSFAFCFGIFLLRTFQVTRSVFNSTPLWLFRITAHSFSSRMSFFQARHHGTCL